MATSKTKKAVAPKKVATKKTAPKSKAVAKTNSHDGLSEAEKVSDVVQHKIVS